MRFQYQKLKTIKKTVSLGMILITDNILINRSRPKYDVSQIKSCNSLYQKEIVI